MVLRSASGKSRDISPLLCVVAAGFLLVLRARMDRHAGGHIETAGKWLLPQRFPGATAHARLKGRSGSRDRDRVGPRTGIGGPLPKRIEQSVFISHSADETDIAQWLKAQLTRDFLGALDIYVSSDRETVSAGERLLDALGNALKTTDLQILVLSRETIGRPWINFEAGAVWLRGIPVVPVCHSGLAIEDLRPPLTMRDAIVLTDSAGLAQLL